MKLLNLLSILMLMTVSAFAGDAKEGPGVSGGGNLKPSELAGNKMISTFIDTKAKVFAKMAFRNESLTNTLGVDQTKMVGIIDRAVVRMQRPACRDATGRKMDASANAVTNEICFSLDRMEKKVPIKNYGTVIFALFVHEVSHLAGASEVLAEKMQDQVLQSSEVSGQSFDLLADELALKAGQLRLTSTLFLNSRLSDSPSEICSKVIAFIDEPARNYFYSVTQRFESTTQLRPFDSVDHNALRLKIGNLKTYCLSTPMAEVIRSSEYQGTRLSTIDIESVFNDDESLLPLKEYERRVSGREGASPSQGIIRSLKTGDLRAVADELRDIVALLRSEVAVTETLRSGKGE